MTEVLGVPINDDGGEQVQSGHTEVLAFGCSIADFALATNAQGILEGMMGFTFVEADLGSTLHVGIEQPVDDEQCPFDPSDFPQCNRKVVLPGTGAERTDRPDHYRAQERLRATLDKDRGAERDAGAEHSDRPSIRERLDAVLNKPRERLELEDEVEKDREVENEREIDREVDRDRGLSH